jgi:RNA ligase (TIGR02306 family)
MSLFQVSIQKIAKITDISGADKIQLASLESIDFTFIIGKNSFQIGEQVVYFPLDSKLPETLIEKLGLTGKLKGNRIKTLKLNRFGVFSQGFVSNINILNDLYLINANPTSEEITIFLGVTKWEAEEITNINNDKGVRKFILPSYVSKYDIESTQNFKEATNQLLEERVFITEKVEGQNHLTSIEISLDKTRKIHVCSRNLEIVPKEDEINENQFLLNSKNNKTVEFCNYLADRYNDNVLVYGEQAGPCICGNIYKFTELKLFLFDIKIGQYWLTPDKFLNEINGFYGNNAKDIIVPILGFDIVLKDWLNGRTVIEASNGKSLLGKTNREGIVIKPMSNIFLEGLRGRPVLKTRDPIYLADHES